MTNLKFEQSNSFKAYSELREYRYSNGGQFRLDLKKKNSGNQNQYNTIYN